jgi:molybdate transport system substrate-binding protein
MQRKTAHRNFLDGGAELIIKGEADFGFYPKSAMMSVKGVAVAGMLPQSLDRRTIYSAAIMANNSSPEPAKAFIKYLADPANKKHWKQVGFDPPAEN